jgi:hypothetical protein
MTETTFNEKEFIQETLREFFQRSIEANHTRIRDFFLQECVDIMKKTGIEIAYIKNAAAQVGIK